MFGFFTRKEKVSQQKSVQSAKASMFASSQQGSNAQKEMIRAAWKDTLRFHGVPIEWVRCDVQRVVHKNGVTNHFIYLVIRKWNDQLPRYCYALEKKLLSRLDWYEPKVDHSGMVVSWRYDKNCACPFTEMPKEEYWVPKVEEFPSQKPLEFLDRRRHPRPANAPIYIRDDQQVIRKDVLYAPTSVSPLS